MKFNEGDRVRLHFDADREEFYGKIIVVWGPDEVTWPDNPEYGQEHFDYTVEFPVSERYPNGYTDDFIENDLRSAGE